MHCLKKMKISPRKVITFLILFFSVITLNIFLFPQKASADSITDIIVVGDTGLGDSVGDTFSGSLTFTLPGHLPISTAIMVYMDPAYTYDYTQGYVTVDLDEGDFDMEWKPVYRDLPYFLFTATTSAKAGDQAVIKFVAGGANDIINPPTPGNYFWSVELDDYGFGITTHIGAGLHSVDNAHKLKVTTTVPPVIDMELYQTGTSTELTDPNSCPLGVLSLVSVNNCNYDIGTGTNSSGGVTLTMRSSGGLVDALANNIDACDNSGCSTGGNNVTAGHEEYGFRITSIGDAPYATEWAVASFAGGGDYDDNDRPVPQTETTIATTSTTGSGTNTGQQAQHMELTHYASMDTATVVGSYQQSIVFQAYTN